MLLIVLTVLILLVYQDLIMPIGTPCACEIKSIIVDRKAGEIMHFVASVCLFVNLSVCSSSPDRQTGGRTLPKVLYPLFRS